VNRRAFRITVIALCRTVPFAAILGTSLHADVWFPYTGCPRYSAERSLSRRVPTPPSYRRITLVKNSFGDWIRHLPVRTDRTVPLTYSSQPVQGTPFASWMVVDLPLLFRQDLEQCADWALRFWHDYQKQVGYGESRWLLRYDGTRISLGEWRRTHGESASDRDFLRWSFTHANTHSQKAGLRPVTDEASLLPGDLLVQNNTGGIGHTTVILDICENQHGERLYLAGFGFMPAQEFHVERAPEVHGYDGWFTAQGLETYLTQRFPGGPPVRRTFVEPGTFEPGDDPVADFERYNRLIRDGGIAPERAQPLLEPIVTRLKEHAQRYSFRRTPWIFPVEGYDIQAVGESGRGYRPNIRYGVSVIKGYSFFDGNRHGGHPAHDIFIRDRNQDSVDDRTGKPVHLRAMLDGIVVTVNTGWTTGSHLRGGNTVVVYHPQEDLFAYYAHLATVTVARGELVHAGDRLGTIGRTGRSAAEPRSPTHVHLMVSRFVPRGRHGYADLEPVDFYPMLRNSRTDPVP
jgi:murein DD-endopeptidase MepM/ murein hydrolase activator NlpD